MFSVGQWESFIMKTRKECFRYALIGSSRHGEAGGGLTRSGRLMLLSWGASLSFSDLSSVGG